VPLPALEARARRIPSMDGRKIGPRLREYVRACVRDGEAVVELGCWLGAGTAQLCLGLREAGIRAEVHSYDRFEARATERSKAASAGLKLKAHENTMPWVRRALAPFGCDVRLHRGDIHVARYDGPPVALHVDDACKREPVFLHALATWGRAWIPGRTIVVLMDYWYWRVRKHDDEGLRFQHQFVSARPRVFEEIWNSGDSPAAFLYKGGLKI